MGDLGRGKNPENELLSSPFCDNYFSLSVLLIVSETEKKTVNGKYKNESVTSPFCQPFKIGTNPALIIKICFFKTLIFKKSLTAQSLHFT